MKLNKNEQNYLLTILFKSYILQSVISVSYTHLTLPTT